MSFHKLERVPSAIFSLDDEDNSHQQDETNLMATTQTKIQCQNRATTNQLCLPHTRLLTPSPRQPAQKRRAQSATSSRRISRDIELIDLITPPKASIIMPTTNLKNQPNYTIRTLTIYNQRRRSILPTFPSMTYTHELDLLLANVPLDLLSTQEIIRRQSGLYPPIFKIENLHPSSGSIMIKQYNKYFDSILERFKMDLSILDHNYDRLDHFMDLFRTSRLRQIGHDKSEEDLLPLKDVELPQLFEFYLQMDVDLFYMKTCSYRGAQPRSIHEGIFCLQTPQCLYAMSKCNHCELCVPINTNIDTNSPVLFDNYNRHRFVNGYESILNCPADCNTKNFIYVLTCVCNKFDYICETKFTLGRRLQDHRQLANHFICRMLIGKENFKMIPINKELKSLLSQKETMQLYQHSSQCSAAIQLFLNQNPSYGVFIPMTTKEANQDNTNNYRLRTTTTTTTTTTDTCPFNQNDSIRKFLNNLPVPPHGFKFSKRQIEQQIEFFQMNKMNELFHDQVNIYNAAIIAILPPHTSDLLRHMVHSLFVTHTEAKLNTLGHIFDFPEYHTLRHGIWCANLKRPPNF